MAIIPRRSVMYLPATNSRAIEKSRTMNADTVIFDLEDSVSPDKKREARTNLQAELAAGGFDGKELVVRINTVDSPWGRNDLEALAASQANAICLPKVETAAQIKTVCELLDKHGGRDKSLWIMAETPKGIINIDTLVCADERIAVLLMGTSDLAKELRVPVTAGRAGLEHVLQRCIVAARLAGIDAIDGVHVDLDDEQGLIASCKQGHAFGFDGKSLIHPKQLAAANDCFAPDFANLEHAKKVIAAWQQNQSSGAGVIVVDGKLIEQLHVDTAQRLLALHQAIAARSAS